MSDAARRLIALIVLVLGALQAWDSGAFAAGFTVAMLALAGVAAGGLPLLVSRDLRVWVAGIVSSAILLIIARLVSPTSLNELHLILLVAAIAILAASGVIGRKAATR
ncbi:MAG TPA: hypothetical protein VF178_02585 [Gemmatimonadaceae bacterium]